MNKPSRSMNIGITYTVKRSDISMNSLEFSNPSKTTSSSIPRQLRNMKSQLYMGRSSTSSSQESLIREVLDILDSPVTTAKSPAVSRWGGSSRTPQQARELLLDNGESLDALIQSLRKKIHCESTSDCDSDMEG